MKIVKPKNLTLWEKLFGVQSNYSHCKKCGDRLRKIKVKSYGPGYITIYRCVSCNNKEKFYSTGH